MVEACCMFFFLQAIFGIIPRRPRNGISRGGAAKIVMGCLRSVYSFINDNHPFGCCDTLRVDCPCRVIKGINPLGISIIPIRFF